MEIVCKVTVNFQVMQIHSTSPASPTPETMEDTAKLSWYFFQQVLDRLINGSLIKVFSKDYPGDLPGLVDLTVWGILFAILGLGER